ncbi:MAG: 2Fe-2S iron-sulfur cluster binding domain-containing protein [Gammaproteobacteria bacterium]|nr:2Fe-2S iron-sulfur cluster binding domain-containing protein [Gammaproteobacteria bacterium]
MYQISIEDSDEVFDCAADRNVLKAMEKLGRSGIPIGCRGGGCGVCRVQVLGKGQYHTGKMSREQVPADDEKKGICLACKLIPESNLRLKVLGKWQKHFSDNRVSENQKLGT